MAECPIWIGDAAVNMVSLAYDKYTEFATASFQVALDQINALTHYDIRPATYNTVFALDDTIFGYTRPTKPTAPADLVYHAPPPVPAPPDIALPPVTFDPAPAPLPNPAPLIKDYQEPGPIAVAPPGAAPTLTPVVIPAEPDLTLPEVPTLEALNIPAPPSVTLPLFQGTRPNLEIDVPLQTLAFSPTEYQSALLDKTRGRVSTMLDGDTGLPSAVAQALRDRAYASLDVQETRAVQQAIEEWSTRGFDEPDGQLQRRVAEVRQNNQNQRGALNRDIYIQDQSVAIENLRFAVTSAISLESTLIQAHHEFMRIALAAAQAVLDSNIAVFNARVTLANAQVAAYQADAQVFETLMRGELAKLDVFRAQLEAERLRGELNEQSVRIYAERIRAVNAMADIYRAKVEAAKAQADANQSVIEAFRTEVQAYAASVDAYTAEWNGYRAKLESNETRARVYELVEQATATRLGTWNTAQQLKLRQQEMRVSEADLNLRGWRGKLDKALADIGAERDRLGSLSEVFRSQVAAYQAEAGVEATASDANLRKLMLALERERSRTSVELENARNAITQFTEINRLLVEVKRTVATVASQLAAASMSAVNFSAGVHSGRSESQSCNTSFNYSGEIV